MIESSLMIVGFVAIEGGERIVNSVIKETCEIIAESRAAETCETIACDERSDPDGKCVSVEEVGNRSSVSIKSTERDTRRSPRLWKPPLPRLDIADN